jgi:VanZ family protein
MSRKPGQSVFWRIVWTSLVIAVVVGSLLPGDSPVLKELDSLAVNDKAEHFLAYAGLAFVPTLHETVAKLRGFLALAAIMGILLELGQLLVPGRTCDLYDAFADGVGILAGFLLALPIRATIKP